MIVESDIIDAMRNRYGSKAFRTLPSGVIVMAKLPREPVFKKKDGKLVRDLRMTGYGECGRMTRVLADTLRAGYVQRPAGTTAAGMFMSENAAAFCTVTVTESGELLYDYKFDTLLVSSGDAAKPKTTVTFTAEARKIMIEQEAETTASSRRNPDDQVFACVLDTVNFESELMELRERGESGSTAWSVPEEWDMENTVVYTFAVFANNQRVSDPNYYRQVTERELAAIAECERLAEEEAQRLAAEGEKTDEEEKKEAARRKLTRSQQRRQKEAARARGVQRATLDRINDDIARMLADKEE